MKFQTGYINDIPYWGMFETRATARQVIHDLSTALGSGEGIKNERSAGEYVVAFSMHGKLYISRRGYHALIASKRGITHAKVALTVIPYPQDGVLVLSKDYLDDLPGYTNATEFCQTMSQQPMPQYCVPLPGTQR